MPSSSRTALYCTLQICSHHVYLTTQSSRYKSHIYVSNLPIVLCCALPTTPFYLPRPCLDTCIYLGPCSMPLLKSYLLLPRQIHHPSLDYLLLNAHLLPDRVEFDHCRRILAPCARSIVIVGFKLLWIFEVTVCYRDVKCQMQPCLVTACKFAPLSSC